MQFHQKISDVGEWKMDHCGGGEGMRCRVEWWEGLLLIKQSKWGWEKLLEMWGRVILIQNQVGRMKISMEV